MAPVSPVKSASAVRFEATLYTIDGSAIARLPDKASKQLPSRGQVAVQATVNGHVFQTVIEPDGEFGHWMRMDARQQRAAAIRAGDTTAVELVPLDNWPEPQVPQDLQTPSLPRRRRSRSCGRTSRRWRAGNGSDGSTRPATPIRVGDGSKSASPRCRAGSVDRVASTSPRAPTPTFRRAASWSFLGERPGISSSNWNRGMTRQSR